MINMGLSEKEYEFLKKHFAELTGANPLINFENHIKMIEYAKELRIVWNLK